MNNIKNLEQKKADAKEAYKVARAEYLATCTHDNIKGDFEKFKTAKNAERICMMLGVII